MIGQISFFFFWSSQIYFGLGETGELRKVLSERTGLHPQDQKIFFKDKERDSAAYLDTSGVKERSKLVVVEDPAAKAKRVLEMRRAAKLEKAVKSISEISLEVDKLASQVRHSVELLTRILSSSPLGSALYFNCRCQRWKV